VTNVNKGESEVKWPSIYPMYLTDTLSPKVVSGFSIGAPAKGSEGNHILISFVSPAPSIITEEAKAKSESSNEEKELVAVCVGTFMLSLDVAKKLVQALSEVIKNLEPGKEEEKEEKENI